MKRQHDGYVNQQNSGLHPLLRAVKDTDGNRDFQ